MSSSLVLDENRFFDPDPGVRRVARELYQSVKDLPIVSPHGHVDPSLFSENRPFPDPTELILIPDHYVFRMLYSQGVSLESLGIASLDGTQVETDHRKIWQKFGDHFYLFAGTPTGIWLNHEFYHVFGIREKLDGRSAMRIYETIQEKLGDSDFLPRTLFERFQIEVLTTTDAAEDTLEHHDKIRRSGWNGTVIPCFRPDRVIQLAEPRWKSRIHVLEERVGFSITSFSTFIRAIEERRAFFKSMGAVSTDQGVTSPYTHRLAGREAEELFQKALRGKADTLDEARFVAHMLMEMARMSMEDGLVMQIHPGSFRNHNRKVFDCFGPDKGCDIPLQTEYTRNLQELLNAYGNETRFKLIVFTLDESCYSRELAPLAGHYPAMKLGPPWWFHDSVQGMTRFRRQVTETAGIYNTVGFNDDTRAFPSIPARHDLSRRVDCNFLAGMVACHIIDMDSARHMSRALSYDLVRQAYNLN
jgi:glucuronate isomerase